MEVWNNFCNVHNTGSRATWCNLHGCCCCVLSVSHRKVSYIPSHLTLAQEFFSEERKNCFESDIEFPQQDDQHSSWTIINNKQYSLHSWSTVDVWNAVQTSHWLNILSKTGRWECTMSTVTWWPKESTRQQGQTPLRGQEYNQHKR